jgi:hypothetical protein
VSVVTSASNVVERQGKDWRLRGNRREAFLRFYWFHLRYRSHPGAVYYALPALMERYLAEPRQRLWLAYLNAHTQNVVSTSLIFRAFPDPQELTGLERWFDEHRKRLQWDTDRRHWRVAFPEAAQADAKVATDVDAWTDTALHGWGALWEKMTSLKTFGRLSSWSGLEFYRLAGVRTEATDLMLEDRDGSRSHRNGLAIVSGQDHLDWHASNPRFNGRYDDPTLQRLATAGAHLLNEASEYAPFDIPQKDIGYLTLESALCTYKSWHRPNRRYPNVYNDMFHDRIKRAEQNWPEVDFDWWWKLRQRKLPKALRLEDNPDDPGVSSEKQNWYRTTGEIPMLAVDWPDKFPCSALWAP